MITGKQCQAARSLLCITQADLSEDTELSTMALSAFEKGRPMRASNVLKVTEALEARGVIFIGSGEASGEGGEGVRLK